MRRDPDDTSAADAADQEVERALANLRRGIERAREQVRAKRRMLAREQPEDA